MDSNKNERKKIIVIHKPAAACSFFDFNKYGSGFNIKIFGGRLLLGNLLIIFSILNWKKL